MYVPGRSAARGFSLVELLVVLSVAVVLTGLLMPAMAQLREAAHRVVSASNMRQLDMGVLMFANDWKDELPYSYYLDLEALEEDGVDARQPQEL
ncbi:MAG: prepilin-type N-terminal cleavage/methylation domain-containing protein, partial [Phycisphaerales bacterium]